MKAARSLHSCAPASHLRRERGMWEPCFVLLFASWRCASWCRGGQVSAEDWTRLLQIVAPNAVDTAAKSGARNASNARRAGIGAHRWASSRGDRADTTRSSDDASNARPDAACTARTRAKYFAAGYELRSEHVPERIFTKFTRTSVHSTTSRTARRRREAAAWATYPWQSGAGGLGCAS